MRNRWAEGVLLGALVLAAWPTAADAGQAKIYTVSGDITAKSFPGLAQFLDNVDKDVVGLKISFPQVDSKDPDDLSAVIEDGSFIASGPSHTFELVADSGFKPVKGRIVFDGYYTVSFGGMNQGITSLFLTPVSQKKVKALHAKPVALQASRLDAKIKKAD